MDPSLLWLALAVGFGISGWAWMDLRLGRRTERWPQAPGKVLANSVAMAPFGPGRYVVKVRYAYTIGGDRYEGALFSYRHFDSKPEAELAAYHFPVGDRIAVRYDPERPDHAVLLAGAGRQPFLQFWVGLAIVGGAIAGLVWKAAV